MQFSPTGGLLKVDVVICTKDRYAFVPRVVSHVRDQLPWSRIIVVDSSPRPKRGLLRSLEVEAFFTPDVLLGVSRQVGLEAATSDIVAFIDDDITLGADWFAEMYAALMSDPRNLAVSSKVVFGWQTDRDLERLHNASLRGEGASIGVALLKRREVLALGGFNPLTHRGEDAELELKMKAHGYRWARCNRAVAYHKLTSKEYMGKAVDNADGWILLWRNSKHRIRFIVERTGSFLFMPIYYLMLTRSLKIGYIYAEYKARTLFAFLRRIKQ